MILISVIVNSSNRLRPSQHFLLSFFLIASTLCFLCLIGGSCGKSKSVTRSYFGKLFPPTFGKNSNLNFPNRNFAKSKVLNRRTGQAVTTNNGAPVRLNLGGDTAADLTITIKTDGLNLDGNSKDKKGKSKTTAKPTSKKDKKKGVSSDIGGSLTPYGYGYKHKDDFDDDAGFYSGTKDADDYYGSYGGHSSNQYHYTGYEADHGHHHGHGGTKGHEDLYGSKKKETSFSLISFVTFASFLLFFLNPLLTLPKRQRLAHLWHLSNQDSTTHVHHHGAGPPPPGVEHSPPSTHQESAGFMDQDSGQGYQSGKPSWAGGSSGGHSSSTDTGWQPMSSYGAGEGGGGNYQPQSSYSSGDDNSYSNQGYQQGFPPWGNSNGMEWGGGGSGSKDMAMSPSAKPLTILSGQQLISGTGGKMSSKKKKKKMRTASSEVSRIYNVEADPNFQFQNYQNQYETFTPSPYEAITQNPNRPDDSILTKEEILQLLQNIDNT